MYLPRLIKYPLFSLFFSIFLNSAFSQETPVVVESPYHNEYNPWFKFGTFKRGFRNELLTQTLDSLEAKPRKYWTRTDSLSFARASKKTGNLDLAAYYFDNLDVDYTLEYEFWWDRLVIHFLNREFNSCLYFIREAEPGLVEHSKLWFFKKICEAKLVSLKDDKWYKEKSVLEWEIDSSVLLLDKDGPEFHEKVITPLENLSYVLEKLIRHIYDNDPVIARTCFEMGKILDAYVSSTQAYIIMSIARNYNKWDKEILAGIKEVKAKMIEKKYRIPIFRKFFPRVEYWRFDYEMLKEKISYERNDTVIKTPPVLMKPAEDEEPIFNTQIILIIGLTVVFLSVLIFLKPRKR